MTTIPHRHQSCIRCTQIKQACDGSSPCPRCLRLSVPCVPKPGGLRSVEYTTSADGVQAKARIARVHTGCFSCKKRKKKCDELKPKCGNCRRLNLPCSWPTERGHWRSTIRTILPTSSSSFRGPSLARCDEQSDYPANPDNYVVATDESPHCTDLQEPQKPLVTSPIMLLGDTHSMTTLSVSDLSLIKPTPFPDLTAREDRGLLDHFIYVVAPILSRRGKKETNPYLTYLLPLAAKNDIVIHSILALSAKHWRKCVPQLAAQGSVHQSQATRSLAMLLPQVDRMSADLALVSSLILCMTELFDGVSTFWKFHLTGAKRLLDALHVQRRGKDMTSYHRFLVRLYYFMDSATTTSTCRPPTVAETKHQNRHLPELDRPSHVDENFAIYGIPKILFHLVDRVNTLAFNRRYRVDEASEADFRKQATKVKHLIENWSNEYGGVWRAVSQLCSGDPDAHSAAIAFEWALRLRLHQIVEGYKIDYPIVSDAVKGIVDAVQKISHGSSLGPCLVFPLVMAGGACSDLESRVIIQDRLLVLERTCGFGYFYNTRELLERVWKRRQENLPGTIVNWAKIRHEEMGGLVIF